MIGIKGISDSYKTNGMDDLNGIKGWLAKVDGKEGNLETECQTCKNRKYQDGSDEMVSFKTPSNISPEESYGKVMSHEKEHVSNAIAEGSKENKELLSTTVSLSTSICPECGRTYVSGGTTRTVMKTYKEDTFSQNKKAFEQQLLTGNNVDYET